MEKMASVLQHDPGPPNKANIKTEDSSAQTNTSVNTDAVTEHEHAQDLPQTSGFPVLSTGNNFQCKQETTGYWINTANNNGNVDLASTCNCNDTADFRDIKEGVTVTAKYGDQGTGVSFQGEVKLIKDTCEFTVGVQNSLFSMCIINGPGIEELKNNIVRFVHNANNIEEDVFRCNKPHYGQITKEDCDIPDRKAAYNLQPNDEKYTCIKCGEDCICTFSFKQQILAPEEFKQYLCEKCTSTSQTSDSTRLLNLETIPDSGEGTEQNTVVNSSMVKHTQQTTHLCDDCGNVFTSKRGFEEHRRIHTGQKTYTCTYCGRSFRRKSDFDKHSKTHTKENTFKCTECGKAFYSKDNLHKHRQTHTGSKAYKYTDCQQTLKQEINANSNNTSTQQKDCDQASHNSDETIVNTKPTRYNFAKRNISKDENRGRCKITAQHHPLVDNDNFIPDDLGDDNDAECHTTQSKHTASEGGVNNFTRKKCHLCEKCGKLCYAISNLEKHMLVHTEERPYRCSQCEKNYKYNAGLRTHMRIHTGERLYNCTHCDIRFTQKSYLISHLRTHTGERPHECLQCGKTYKHNTHLKRHLRAHTGERPYKCTYCHKTFTTKHFLTEHIKTHTGEKPYNCTYCDMTFTQKSNLNVHIRTHTGEKPYKCTYCHMIFTQQSSLTAHIRTHTGEKPYKCTYCDMTFTQKSNLTVHSRTHTGEKPYKCTYCHMTFTKKNSLTVHIRTHTGEEPHKCTYCKMTFTRKNNLTVHIRTHTKEKPYKCTYCDMTFTQKSHLTVHLRTHTGEKPHTCIFCEKKFITKQNLRAHTLLHTKH